MATLGNTLAPETPVDDTELCAAEENAEESSEATTPEAKVDEELAELAVVETE